jgi:hypothetical protein
MPATGLDPEFSSIPFELNLYLRLSLTSVGVYFLPHPNYASTLSLAL